MKKSLIRQIAAIFLIAIVIAVSIECLISWAFYNRYTQNHSKRLALSGIRLAEALLDEQAELESPEINGNYFKNRVILSKVCVGFGLKYMYIKKPDASGDRGVYIYAVASDPEEDEDSTIPSLKRSRAMRTLRYGMRTTATEVCIHMCIR